MFVITGGGSGIGRALAHALANRGEAVLVIGRSEHTLAESAAIHPLIHYVVADVATLEGRQLIQAHLQDTPSLRGFVHNAGVIEPITSLMDIEVSSWHHIMATNLDAPLFLTQQFHDKLIGGRVLMIGSGAACMPMKGLAAYCVSKAALSMLTRCWQLELASGQIAVTSVKPGIIDTNMQTNLRHADALEAEKQNFYIMLKEKQLLLSSETVALFLSWLLLDLEPAEYMAQEWDIYDTTHHKQWLVEPHQVPVWE